MYGIRFVGYFLLKFWCYFFWLMLFDWVDYLFVGVGCDLNDILILFVELYEYDYVDLEIICGYSLF